MSKTRLIVFVSLAVLLIAVPLLGACTSETEKIVTKEVPKEVIKEVPVEKVVEKEVIKEVPVEVVVEKEVIKEIEVIKEVAVEKIVEVEKAVGAPSFEFFHIMHTWAHPFWATAERGAIEASRIFNVKTNFVYFEGYDVVAQANRVDEVQALNPDGIVISVSDPPTMDGAARRAIAAGIPIIAANAADPRPADERIPYLFYVGSDERTAGQSAAWEVLKVKPDIQVVGLATSALGAVQLEARMAGARDILEPRGVDVITVEVTDDVTKVKERTRAHFTARPDTEGWITMGNVPMVPIGREYFLEEGLSPVMVTFDFSPDTPEYLADGTLSGAIDQQIWLQGYAPIEWLYLYNEYGFSLGGDILTGPFVVTTENVDFIVEGIEAGYRF